jgi:hypothetical protein
LNLLDLKASAERELGAFIRVVTDSFGSEEARLAAEDWLEEMDSMDLAHELTVCHWRAITIAAAVRLSVRLNTASNVASVSPESGADVSPIP